MFDKSTPVSEFHLSMPKDLGPRDPDYVVNCNSKLGKLRACSTQIDEYNNLFVVLALIPLLFGL